MGLSSGSLTYTRLITVGDLPENHAEAWCEALEQHAFHEIEVAGDLEQSWGWVQSDDPFESSWHPHTLLRPGDGLLLCLRIDTLKIPATTLKAWAKRHEKERMAAMGRERLSRAERDQLKDEVKRRLRRQSLPKMQLIEAAWNLTNGELRLMSTSKALVGRFVDVFEKTFHLQLRSLDPLTLLWARELGDEQMDAVARLDSEPFHI